MQGRWNSLRKSIKILLAVIIVVLILIIIVWSLVKLWVLLWTGPTKKYYFKSTVTTVESISFNDWKASFNDIEELNESLSDFDLSKKLKERIIDNSDDYTVIKMEVLLQNDNNFPLNEITVNKVSFPYSIKPIIRKKDSAWYKEMFCKPSSNYNYVVEIIVSNEELNMIEGELSKNDIIVSIYGKKSDIYT